MIQPSQWFRCGLPTWWRHLFVRFGLLVVSLAALAFGLFVFVDAITHVKDIFDPQTTWTTWETYYLCLLCIRAGVVLPFAVVTATALLIPQLVRSNSFIPLLNAGVSLQKIVRPFFTVTLLVSCLLCINTQYFLPKALRHQHRISDSDFGRESVKEETARLGVVLFPEGSRLFFCQHDPVKKQIDDSFWVRSPDCILHIERLQYFKDRAPEGRGVDVIERDQHGQMQKTASYPFLELSQLQFTKETVKLAMSDPRHLSLSQLGSLVSRFGNSRSERATETTIAFFSALFFPLLTWLALLIPAPLCFRFERRFPQIFIVFASLASLFCFLLIIHASQILARIPIVRPSLVLVLPWACALFMSFRRLQRLV